MSNTLTRAARHLMMRPNDKMVLMALADMARDPDAAEAPAQTWPPMHGKNGSVGLCDWTCLSERAVQRSIKALVAAGHISRRQLSHGARYTVHPSPDCQTGEDREGASPVPQSGDCQTPSPDCQSPKALGSTNRRKKTTSSSSIDRAASAHGARLSPEFEPPIEWLAWAAEERGWSNAEAADEFASFRDYWIAQPGARGRKADWPATWRNWVRRSRRTPQNVRGNHHERSRQPMGARSDTRGPRPDPALDLRRAALAELAEEARAGAGEAADRGPWPSLPAHGTHGP